MDEQRLQELLTHEYATDSFTNLCQIFGGGGIGAFWTAARLHDWEAAAQLANEYPPVPNRTRIWLNKHGQQGDPYQFLIPLTNS